MKFRILSFSLLVLFFVACKGYLQQIPEGENAATTGGSSGNVATPTAGASLTFSAVSDSGMTVTWGAATDSVTAQANLQYRLVYATVATDIDSIAKVDAITGAQVASNYAANLTTFAVTGLAPLTSYSFAVVVRNDAGGKTLYPISSQTTSAAGSVASPSFNPVSPQNFNTNLSVVLATATSGAIICYTTDNSLPACDAPKTGCVAPKSQLYTAAINFTVTTTIKAIACKNGSPDSAAERGDYVFDDTAPTVGSNITFSSVADTTMTINWGAGSDNITTAAKLQYRIVWAYSSADIDTIAEVDASTNVVQDYTANTTTKNVTGLNVTTTYYFAIVLRDEAGNQALYSPRSQQTTAPGVVASPAFNPSPPRVFNSAQSVVVTTATAGATLCYTVDGTAPACDASKTACTGGTIYSTALSLVATTPLKAIACKSGSTDSSVTTGSYTYDNVSPTVTPSITFSGVSDTSLNFNWGAASDNYTAQNNLVYRVVKASSSGAIDTIAEVDAITGLDLLANYLPNLTAQAVTGLTGSTTYFFAVVVRDEAGNKTLYAPQSETTSAPGVVVSPVLNPTPPVLFIGSQNVALSTATSGAIICYTDNGTTPACNATPTCTTGTEYSSAFNLVATKTIQAIACKNGMTASSFTSGLYTLDTRPRLVASTPADAATGIAVCSGTAPCTAKIVLQFSESMQTGTPTLTTEIETDAVYYTVPSTGSTFTWSTTAFANDTLTIRLSWYWFPESAKVRYTLPAAGLKDSGGDAIAADVVQTFTTTWAGRNFTAADTGLTTCYDAAGVGIACANASYPRQDADYVNTPAARSFTGPTQHVSYTSDYTTKDNVTNLVWKSCTEGQTGASCNASGDNTNNYGADSGVKTWYNALNACSALNAANSGAGYAGVTSWRLPTSTELESLIHFGQTNPSMDAANFPTAVSSAYWAASTKVGSPQEAWTASYNIGTSSGATRSEGRYIRCVSSPDPLATTRFVDNNDETIKDNRTNLIWQKCSLGQSGAGCASSGNVGDNYNAQRTDWAGALNTCKNLTLASKTWRLPSVTELLSVMDKSRAYPSIDTSFFPVAVSDPYWTSTTIIGQPENAWYIYFSMGLLLHTTKIGSNHYVRCVAN